MNLHDRRQRLASQIETFTSNAATFLAIDDPDAADLGNDGTVSDSNSDIDDDEIIPEEIFRPELTTLPLPSAFGLEWCARPENQKLVEQELALRKGQANDALHQLRLGLAEKAFLFRTDIRNADSQAKKTRVWDGFHALESNVRHYVHTYSQSRKALVQLGADDKLLEKYKVLKVEHTKVSTAVVDITKSSRAEATLAWFWRTDVERDTDSNDWLAERKSNLNDFAI